MFIIEPLLLIPEDRLREGREGREGRRDGRDQEGGVILVDKHKGGRGTGRDGL